MLYLTNLDLNKNQLLNAVMQNLSTAPASPTAGQVYFNTSDKILYIYSGTSWVALGGLMSAEDIVTAINQSIQVIDLDNLPSGVDTAVTNSHTHSNKTTLDAITAAFTTTLKTKLDGIESGAQVNAVNSVAGKTGIVTLSNADVGLSNVTNDAQVKKRASSTSGRIPTWNGTTGDALNDGYAVETTLSGSSTAIPRADAVKTYVDGLLSANDAMVFKGTIGSGGTITTLPTTHSAGWTYRVITAGTYAGVACEIGDLIVAIVNRTGSGNLNTDWTVVQTNIDGAVIGAVSATSGNFPIFSGTSGKLIANSSYSPSSFASSSHNHDGVYSKKYTTTVGGSTSQVITHNLNSRELAVTLRETASPYAQVIADIEFTTVNTVTVKFAVAPTAGQYTITVVG